MIDRFQGPNRFLSNFYPAAVTLEGTEYPTVEHAYQAAKTTDLSIRRMIRRAATPGDAKRLGKTLVIRPEWHKVRLEIMEQLVREKFTRHVELKRRLYLTGHEELIEGNMWGDCFWGVCGGKGENQLGKILMKVREELRAQGDIG